MYSFGYLSQNLVGFIYYNNKEKLIQIAYIDFWGKRKDVVCPTSDIHLKNKSDSNIFGVSVVKESTDEEFRINLKFGKILDETLYTILSNK